MEEAALKNRNSLEQSLEIYLERVDELAIRVMSLEEQMLDAADQVNFSEEVRKLTEKCSAYRVAKRAADHYRTLDILGAEEARTEQETRVAFAAACKALDDNWTEMMMSPIACGCDASGKSCHHAPGCCQNHALVALCSRVDEEGLNPESGICVDCWNSGGVFRAPVSKKPAGRGAVA